MGLLNEADKVILNGVEQDAVYLGDTLVWPSKLHDEDFTASGTYTARVGGFVQPFIVAGGGSGGVGASNVGGSGGGAGGIIGGSGQMPVVYVTKGAHPIVVGAGGVAAAGGSAKGGDSSAFGLTAVGGGSGGGVDPSAGVGGVGGSGGGSSGGKPRATGTPYQGFSGGVGGGQYGITGCSGGGGGGRGAQGGDSTDAGIGGVGGAGLAFEGKTYGVGGNGGTGGTHAVAAVAPNLGNGGNGAPGAGAVGGPTNTGGNGGSGFVGVRVPAEFVVPGGVATSSSVHPGALDRVASMARDGNWETEHHSNDIANSWLAVDFSPAVVKPFKVEMVQRPAAMAAGVNFQLFTRIALEYSNDGTTWTRATVTDVPVALQEPGKVVPLNVDGSAATHWRVVQIAPNKMGSNWFVVAEIIFGMRQ